MGFLLNRGLTLENRDTTERSEYPSYNYRWIYLKKEVPDEDDDYLRHFMELQDKKPGWDLRDRSPKVLHLTDERKTTTTTKDQIF